MGCGSSKGAVPVAEPEPVPSWISKPTPVRAPTETPPLKIWVSLDETGRRTGVTLSGWDQDEAKTVEDLAQVLVCSHLVRLQQLGFSGNVLVLLDAHGAVRPPREKIQPGELAACADVQTPLRVSLPPQWAAVSTETDLRTKASPPLSQQSQGLVYSSASTAAGGAGSQGSAERAALSPRSKAYRAEIDAIAGRSRVSPQAAAMDAIAKQKDFTDTVKIDIHAHLKRYHIEEEPAHVPPPSEDDVAAVHTPAKVKVQQKGTYVLEAARGKELAMQLAGFTNKYRARGKAALLRDLKGVMHTERLHAGTRAHARTPHTAHAHAHAHARTRTHTHNTHTHAHTHTHTQAHSRARTHGRR